jgi:hypothetical protein
MRSTEIGDLRDRWLLGYLPAEIIPNCTAPPCGKTPWNLRPIPARGNVDYQWNATPSSGPLKFCDLTGESDLN